MKFKLKYAHLGAGILNKKNAAAGRAYFYNFQSY